MRKLLWSVLLLGAAMCVGSTVGARPVAAQAAGQTVENAGHPTTSIAHDEAGENPVVGVA